MGLTLEAEQRLEAAELIALFEKHEARWKSAAKDTYEFVKKNFPDKVIIRPDDIAKPLRPILEVDEKLRLHLDTNKLKQKFWVSHFADLIIERVWSQIATSETRP